MNDEQLLASSPMLMLQSTVPYTSADLQMVQEHVAQGERHIIQQEELISRLRSQGLPTESAEDLLEEFRATLRQHRDHLAIIATSLGDSS